MDTKCKRKKFRLLIAAVFAGVILALLPASGIRAEENQPTHSYDNVSNTYDKEIVGLSEIYEINKVKIDQHKTIVCPFEVKDNGDYILTFYQKYHIYDFDISVLLLDSKGKIVFEEDMKLSKDYALTKAFSLTEGDYTLKILRNNWASLSEFDSISIRPAQIKYNEQKVLTSTIFSSEDSVVKDQAVVYSFDIDKTGEYYLKFDKKGGHEDLNYTILNSKNKSVAEKKVEYNYQSSWSSKESLKKGKYYVKVTSQQDSDDIDSFIFTFMPVKFCKEIEVKTKVGSTETLVSDMGYGDWSSSDENIVDLWYTEKNSKDCEVSIDNTGEASVTWVNTDGAKIIFKFIIEGRDYSKVKKKHSTEKIGDSSVYNISVEDLAENKTEVYPIEITKKGNYLFELFDKNTYGEFSLKIADSNGKILHESDYKLDDKDIPITLSLSKGEYTVNILSRGYGIDVSMAIRSKDFKKTENKTIKSNSTETLEPEFGDGTWTTSDDKIVSIKVAKSTGKCDIYGVKAGKAKVTYTANNGGKVIYSITVKDRFTDVNQTAKNMKITSSTLYNIVEKGLKQGKTNVYPIEISKKGEYYFGFIYDYYKKGDFTFAVFDSKGKSVFEKDLTLYYDAWSKKLTLSKGKYFVKILANDKSQDVKYELNIRPVKYQGTIKCNIACCDTYKAKSDYGKGNWSTSDKKVLEIVGTKKKTDEIKVHAKKPGKATITFTNKDGVKITYKCTVSTDNGSYPVWGAAVSMNYVGGLEPTIGIANNSDSRIKYVNLTVSFYNRVGDRVNNEIGSYKNAKLQATGPIEAWEIGYFSWDPVFYASTATAMKIESVTIEYFGGKKKTYTVNKKYAVD